MKDKMICLACQESAVKNGASNVNNSSLLNSNNNEDLLYSDFDTTNFGIQLDATHLADDSTVNEVTQIISTIAQNNTTDIYLKTYNALSDIVELTLAKYFGEKTTDSYRLRLFTRSFINTLQASKNNVTGKEVLEILESKANLIIPYSNKAFYKPFIASVISKLNTDFIRREFPGIAAVINPNFNSGQIYEDVNGKTYFSEDLIKDVQIKDTGKTFAENYHNRLKVALNSDLFLSQPVTINEINPLDVILFEGEEYPLYSYDSYYQFKRNHKEGEFRKVYNKPRNLKPSQITFKENGVIRNV
jgi:hypothetical protein